MQEAASLCEFTSSAVKVTFEQVSICHLQKDMIRTWPMYLLAGNDDYLSIDSQMHTCDIMYKSPWPELDNDNKRRFLFILTLY